MRVEIWKYNLKKQMNNMQTMRLAYVLWPLAPALEGPHRHGLLPNSPKQHSSGLQLRPLLWFLECCKLYLHILEVSSLANQSKHWSNQIMLIQLYDNMMEYRTVNPTPTYQSMGTKCHFELLHLSYKKQGCRDDNIISAPWR